MIRLKKCSLIWLTLLLLLIATAVNAAEKNFVEIDINSVNDFMGTCVLKLLILELLFCQE